MSSKTLVVATLTGILMSAGAWGLAAEEDAPQARMGGTQAGCEMGGHMMGNMSGRDKGMMGGDMMSMGMTGSSPLMSQLPPGNEKLTLQMRGEMLQAIGQILIKYADKIQPMQPK